ncbi:MAG: hypothetical protein LRY41_01380 [Candidatus Pacebacteria bacterium]|nr:hypothetical protein [Candidatus Paceibacterota bacterium]MCD8508219.1 hypothetical protein [Candidatus Paceibacterota bacterium]MCD8527966.1 hypothetical protein [Candidatus Paceibacterota bacterium]MCD8563583.1 hypothetical protein [Candidatus Paceibacterota bacterium]
MDFLKTLRTKTHTERRRYALIISLVILLCIIGIWIALIAGRFEDNRRERSSAARPVQALRQSISSQFKDFQAHRPSVRRDAAELFQNIGTEELTQEVDEAAFFERLEQERLRRIANENQEQLAAERELTITDITETSETEL